MTDLAGGSDANAGPLHAVLVDTGRLWRGGQAQVLLLARGLRSHGCEVFLFAPAGSPLLRAARAGGIEIASLPAGGPPWWRGAPALRRHLLRHPRSVLHAHTSHAHTMARLVSATLPRTRTGPVVVHRRFVPEAGRSGPMRRFKYRSKIDVYVAISKAVRDGLIEAGVHPDSIRVIPSAIELERFDRDVDPLEVRRAWGLGPKEPLVVSVGSLTPEKDRSTLIEAAARLAAGARGFRLLVVGEGEERRKLAAGIARLGLGERVILCGFLEDPIPLLRAATVFVLSSRREGLGTALLEAAAAGLPAVATRVGGIPEIVEDGATGILVPPEDPEALAGALEELLGDPGRRASMGARARERARGFGAETMVEAVLGVYREASRWRRSGR